MDFHKQQSNVLPNSNFQSSQIRPTLHEELNRFKEIQKNPQLLLQTLSEMERQRKQQQVNVQDEICTKTIICGRSFRAIYPHLKVHNGSVCDVRNCGSVFRSEKKLKNHQLQVHGLGSSKVRRPSGRRRTTSTSRLKVPFDMTQPKKYHICKVCGRTSLRKSALLHHLKIHTGEKPFRCSDCYRTFRFRSGLTSHAKTCFFSDTRNQHSTNLKHFEDF